MPHFPIEHLKSGGTASRGTPMWQQHELRLVLIGDITMTAGGLPFEAGQQLTIGAMFGVVNKEGGIGPWAAPVGDLLAEDWTLHPIETKEDPLA